ncbi:hypothetical protein [Amycolatopsis anabasis]|uniref:hypothetical protein n=1 Tax=Amycolatopsis anabasis TaxID=1840409 RepID=UPI00131E14DD|nr:hypothetical protein [Amycolatopsis anabasis]
MKPAQTLDVLWCQSGYDAMRHAFPPKGAEWAARRWHGLHMAVCGHIVPSAAKMPHPHGSLCQDCVDHIIAAIGASTRGG